MLFIDSDNAMGSSMGNVDDGFAIAALLCSGMEIAGIGSIGGNTFEDQAAENSRKLVELLGGKASVHRGAVRPGDRVNAVSRTIAESAQDLRVVALGPLTNVAGALDLNADRIVEVVLVGSNPSSAGRWPPVWPHESNLTWDREATMSVFESEVSLTVVPLDVVTRLQVGQQDLRGIPGHVGEYLSAHARRWIDRKTRWRMKKSVRIPDLVAAMAVIEPALFNVMVASVSPHENGWLEYGVGRTIEVVESFDPDRVWSRFVELVGSCQVADSSWVP